MPKTGIVFQYGADMNASFDDSGDEDDDVVDYFEDDVFISDGSLGLLCGLYVSHQYELPNLSRVVLITLNINLYYISTPVYRDSKSTNVEHPSFLSS